MSNDLCEKCSNDSPLKKANTSDNDKQANTYDNDKLQELTYEILTVTSLDRDVSGLIAKYTRWYFGEYVGPKLKITETDGLLEPSDYFDTIAKYINEILFHGVVSNVMTRELQPVDSKPIFSIIYTYMVYSDRNDRRLWGAVQSCNFHVLKNIVYVYDSFERHVLGYIKFGDSDPFVFVRDSSIDVFSHLERGLTNVATIQDHNRYSISGFKPGSKRKLLVSISHPTDTSLDIYPTISSSEVLSKIPKVNKEHSLLCEISINRFIQMITHEEAPARFREVINRSDRTKISFIELNTPQNSLTAKMLTWEWWCYQEMLLGYDYKKTLILIRFVEKDVNIQTFTLPFGPSTATSNQFVLCGQWLLWITYFDTHISLRRFSLDVRVLD